MNQTCQPKILKTWRLQSFWLKKKNLHPRYFSTCSVRILLNRYALGYFRFIWQLILACILSYIEKLCCYFVGIWGLWGFCFLWRLMLSINKHTCSSTFLLVKTVDLNVSEHHFFRALHKKWSFFFRISSVNMTKPQFL